MNSYMYDGIKNGKNQSYIDACYSASSTLSSCSQIAIDMAKKEFIGLKLRSQMKHLNSTTFINDAKNKEQVLKYKMDMDNVNEIKISAYLKDYNDKIKSNKAGQKYDNKYILADDESMEIIKPYINVINGGAISESEIKKLEEEKNNKINVNMVKMIVPNFFKYTASDNTYRIPTAMDCSMDYLEKILDEMDTRAIETDKLNIKDLFIMQKELEGRAYNRGKIDKVRYIIDNCKSVLNKNRYITNDDGETKKEKLNLRKWVKKQSVKELRDLQLNDKTVHRLLLRAFNLDKKYKLNTLYKYDKDGNILTYFDYDEDEEFVLTVKELKEMTILTLSLLHQTYTSTFLKCFINKEISNDKKVEKFWK